MSQYPNNWPQQQPQYATPPVYGGYAGHGYMTSAGPPKHSGLGIASFIIALISGVVCLIAIVVAGVMQIRAEQRYGPGAELDENSPELAIVSCFAIMGVLGSVVGLILGIIAATQRDRKKVFGILRLVLNGLIVVGVLGIMAISLAMG